MGKHSEGWRGSNRCVEVILGLVGYVEEFGLCPRSHGKLERY